MNPPAEADRAEARDEAGDEARNEARESNHAEDLRLILASRSPRRASLLDMLGIEFEVIPADVDEVARSGESPRVYAERLAREKATAVAGVQADSLVIGSDTIVILDDEILEKPADRDHAVEMLLRLAGREHMVITAVAVAGPGGRLEAATEEVRVRIRTLDRATARAYADTGEPLDKAGAYGIQGLGASLVSAIEGDFYAVMGLPLVRLLALLEGYGVRYDFRGLRNAGESTRDAPAMERSV